MTDVLITPDQAQKLLSTKNPLFGHPMIRVFSGSFQWICITLLLFIFGYVLFNAPSLYLKTKYLVKNVINHEQSRVTDQSIDSPAFLVPEQNIPSMPRADIDMPDNTLYIPKINVLVPIYWNIESEKIIAVLENGVAHYQGTALPDTEGNVFITGHSSSYFWQKNPYGTVFTLIGELRDGDQIYLKYQGETYEYTVNGKNVVKPNNLQVLESNINERSLTLMTCWPIGTNLQRLIVKAGFVSTINKTVAHPLKYQYSEPSNVKLAKPEKNQQETAQLSFRDVYLMGRNFALPKQVNPVYAKNINVPDMTPRRNPLLFLPRVN